LEIEVELRRETEESGEDTEESVRRFEMRNPEEILRDLRRIDEDTERDTGKNREIHENLG
jgi:hypothetical protein